MVSELKGLYKISRPLTTLTGGLAVLLGGYVAGTGAWGKVILAILATWFISAAANAWNDYRDIEIDKINQPNRPLPAGLISPRSVLIFSLVMTAVSIILAAFINTTAFIIALLSAGMLYLYSWRLKSTVLMGNAIVATISAMSAIFGGIAAGNPRPSLWLAAIIASAIMGREVLKTLADYEGDLRQRCRTVATVWGRRAARVVFYILASATLVVMMLPYLLDVYRPVYALVVALGVYPVLIYVLLRVTRERTGQQLEKLSQLMKYDFMVWFVAVLLGATT
ncbi:geranylgeranylglycerol-phosphate geranylgeranyltransferase [Candidatus Leptofilum sp.]|uniref:geranylgeranylglycerol-phosphate geranylgeranyltransferase n=1 Tax=Candidatus Leptofilum sp. TaxID=3241576 RepID=UPI003B5CCCD7